MQEVLAEEVQLPPHGERIVEEAMVRFGGTSPQYIGTGEHNHVVVIPDAKPALLIKIPKPFDPVDIAITGPPLSDYQRVRYEAHVLEMLLQDAEDSPTPLPEILNFTPDYSHLILGYIPGKTLTDREVSLLPATVLADLAQKLVSEVVFMADVIKPDDDRFMYNRYPQKYATDRVMELLHYPGFSIAHDILDDVEQYALTMVSRGLRKKYIKMYREGRVRRTIVGHNDRRAGNWVFDETADGLRFVSSIDYANTIKTTPEQEFRFVPRLGDKVLRMVVDEYYRQTGKVLDEGLVKFWDRVQIMCRAVRLWTEISFVTSGYMEPEAQIKHLQKLLQPARLQLIRGELERCWPDVGWGEITGDYKYENKPFKLLEAV